jgi:hypothetical protein
MCMSSIKITAETPREIIKRRQADRRIERNAGRVRGTISYTPHGLNSDEKKCFLCTHLKPSCLVITAISIGPPTDFARRTAYRTNPTVVSTRNRDRSMASWIGAAGRMRFSYVCGYSFLSSSAICPGVMLMAFAPAFLMVPTPKIKRFSASSSPFQRAPNSFSD